MTALKNIFSRNINHIFFWLKQKLQRKQITLEYINVKRSNKTNVPAKILNKSVNNKHTMDLNNLSTYTIYPDLRNAKQTVITKHNNINIFQRGMLNNSF